MKRYKKDIEKRERMKNEKYKKSLNNKILFLLFFVYRKRYILLEKTVYAITFLVKFFLCVAAYLKRSNEIPTLMKLLWVSYFDLKYLAIN